MSTAPMGRLSEQDYVLITAAHNEENYIEQTIGSVAYQTQLPKKWVIVSDGSTDRTEEIVHRCARHLPFLSCVSLPPDSQRSFVRQVKALTAAAEALNDLEYGFIGSLDADISFAPDYFNTLLREFERDPKLGVAGGMIQERAGGRFRPRPENRTHSVAGAVQLFRRRCYEAVGGFVPLRYGGHDTLAAFKASSLGWSVRSIPQLKVYHYRTTGAAAGILRSKFRLGLVDYYLGYDPIFEVLKCVRRVLQKPYLISATAHLLGFLRGCLSGETRPVAPEIMDYVRREQKRRIKLAVLRPFTSCGSLMRGHSQRTARTSRL
jgi:biofilm PGA synthesis N-glycosyltransferase PgaC